MATPHGTLQEELFDPVNGKILRYANGVYRGIECINYDPCPVCNRCQNKYPARYKDCKQCKVKGDYHSAYKKNLFMANSPRRKL